MYLFQTEEEIDTEFDTTIHGPHLDKWHVVKHTVHTEKYFAEKRKGKTQ